MEAEKVLDRVIAKPVQEVSFDRTYDCVVCGELLEHLASPLDLLKASALRHRTGWSSYCQQPMYHTLVGHSRSAGRAF